MSRTKRWAGFVGYTLAFFVIFMANSSCDCGDRNNNPQFYAPAGFPLFSPFVNPFSAPPPPPIPFNPGLI